MLDRIEQREPAAVAWCHELMQAAGLGSGTDPDSRADRDVRPGDRSADRPEARSVLPMTDLGPGGPVVSRIGLGLAALGRPAYITGGRSADLPDRSVAGLRARTWSMLDAAYEAQMLVDITYLKKAGTPPMITRVVATGKASPFKVARPSPDEKQQWLDKLLRGLGSRRGAGPPASGVAA